MHRVALTLTIAVALSIASGCGDDASSESPASTSASTSVAPSVAAATVVVRVEPALPVEEAVLRRAVEAYEARLTQLGIAGSVAISDGGLVLTLRDVAAPDRLTETLSVEVEPDSSATIRPVLSRNAGGVGESVLTPRDEVSADGEAILGAYSSADDAVYQVGPGALSGLSVKSAAAEVDSFNDGWQITLELVDGPEGLDRWNELVTRCYGREATCPDGGMAIVVDGKVVSAPVPQTSEFDSPTFMITGDFSEAEATALARLLGPGPAIPFRVVSVTAS